jgi:large subunit ribosomal protein L3
MGFDRVTTMNLTVARIDAAKNLILIKGSVPGPDGGLVMIRSGAKTIAAGA